MEVQMASTKSTGKGKQGGSSAQHAAAGKQSHKTSVSKAAKTTGKGRTSGDTEQ